MRVDGFVPHRGRAGGDACPLVIMLHAYNFSVTATISVVGRALCGPIPDGAILRRLKMTYQSSVTGDLFWAMSLVASRDPTDVGMNAGIWLLDEGVELLGLAGDIWFVRQFGNISSTFEAYFHRRIVGGPQWLHFRLRASAVSNIKAVGFCEWEDDSPDFPAKAIGVGDGSV